MTTSIKWASSEGGPLILISEKQLQDWEGSETPLDGRSIEATFRWSGEPDSPGTDYDRAGDMDEPLGVIDVGLGQGLVLGDEPNSTCWLSGGPTAGALVRWVCGPEGADEEDIAAFISAVPDHVFNLEPFTFIVSDSHIYLFDSALSGSQIISGVAADDAVRIELTLGEYHIETAQYRPNAETWFDFHRLSLNDPEAMLHGEEHN